jgi:hypothetical protein
MGADPPRVRAALTVADLQRWEEHGALWRVKDIGDQRVVVELCTCYGEPVDLVQSEAADVIAHVRNAALAHSHPD